MAVLQAYEMLAVNKHRVLHFFFLGGGGGEILTFESYCGEWGFTSFYKTE